MSLLAAAVAGAAVLSPAASPRKAQPGNAIGAPGVDELDARFRATRDEALRAPLIRAQLASGRYSAALASSADAETDTRELKLLRGEALLQLARFPEAATIADDLIKDRPGDGAAALLAGRAAFARGDMEASSAMALAALRGSGVDVAAAWLFRARLALMENDLQAATSALERAKEAGAGPLELAALEVERLIRSGDLAGAQALAASFPDKNPPGADAQIAVARGLAALVSDDAVSAARIFDELEVTRRADPLFRLWHAIARERAGECGQSERLFRSALVDFPENAIIAVAYGEFLTGHGRYDEIDAISARSEAGGEVARRLALIAATAAGDADLIVASLESGGCISDHQATGEALLGLAGGLIDKRGEAVERLCRLHAASLGGAVRVEDGGDYTGSQSLSVADSGMIAAENVLFGRIALARGDDLAAARHFEAAGVNSAAFAPVAGSIRVLARSGDHKAALELAEAYVALHPNKLEARVALAALSEQAGDRKRAIAALRPAEEAVLMTPPLDAYYVDALVSQNDRVGLVRVASFLSRKRPTVLLAARALRAAGELEEASSAARLALVSDPSSPEAARTYQEIMDLRGRGATAREFLSNLGAEPRSEEVGNVEAPLKSGPIAKELFEKARYDYLRAPSNGVAAAVYAAALERAGVEEEAVKVAREAALWGAFSPPAARS